MLTFVEYPVRCGFSPSPGQALSKFANGSLYHAPDQRFVILMAEDSEVATEVRYRSEKNAQSRGNLWADAFDLSDCSFKDKISGFNVVFIATYTMTASIQGGAPFSGVSTAAYGAGAHFAVPYSTCLGYPGTTLDGGRARDMGLYGLDVDQILRATLATISGKSKIVDDHSDADLLFAITHATPNIGIITSTFTKAYSISEAWERHIYYSPASLAAVVAIIAALHLSPEVLINLRSPNS
ncbi:hypothetical protein XANCAGTX0491_002417 [Xanthoria calcicola]